jgi:hypothetical protein
MMHRILLLALAANVAAAEAQWQHFSTAKGDLPMPWEATEQTAAIVADFDGDGLNDFAIACRKVAPSVLWYRRTANGWSGRGWQSGRRTRRRSSGSGCRSPDWNTRARPGG